MKNKDHSSRLETLSVDSLHKRRLCADLICALKIVFGLNDMNLSDIFTVNSNYRETHEPNPYKRYISYCRVDPRKYIFSLNDLRQCG